MALHEASLGNWVREERRRLDALAGTDAEPLSAADRAELARGLLPETDTQVA